MDIMQIGAKLLQDKLGLEGEQTDSLMSALSGLTDGEGGMDVASLVSSMQASGGFSSLVSSWLGDGDNEAISGGQVSELLGSDKVAGFAAKLGIDEGAAADGLAEMLPQVVDKASSAGSLLDSIGGMDGLMGMASKFMK
jgi:uncharacterized protein YidB (DUF937 family)